MAGSCAKEMKKGVVEKKPLSFRFEVEAPVPLGAGHDVPCLLLQAEGFGAERLIVGQLPQVHVAEELNFDIQNHPVNGLGVLLLPHVLQTLGHMELVGDVLAAVPDAGAEALWAG